MADNPATTTINEGAILSLPIDLANGKTGKVYFTQAHATYFNIPTESATATGGFVRITRAGYTKNTYQGIWDTDSKGKAVRRTDLFAPPRLNDIGGGRTIVVPTQLLRSTGNPGRGFRQTSFKFPSSAILAVISDWLATNLRTRTPAWFMTEANARYSVLPKGSITDLNPGRTAASTPPPAAAG